MYHKDGIVSSRPGMFVSLFTSLSSSMFIHTSVSGNVPNGR